MWFVLFQAFFEYMEKFLLEKVVTKQKILLQSSALPVLRRFHRKDVTDDVLVLEVVVYADIMSELCVKVAEDFPRLIVLGIVFFVWFHNRTNSVHQSFILDWH